MTTMRTIKQLKSLLDDRKCILDGTNDEIYLDDIAALTAAIEAISTACGEKLYTAFDVIRLVQKATSNEICGLGAEEASVAFEVERSIIAELVKENNRETNV